MRGMSCSTTLLDNDMLVDGLCRKGQQTYPKCQGKLTPKGCWEAWLRYPNSHTHYFSCTMLYLFAEANAEAIQEQITRYDI